MKNHYLEIKKKGYSIVEYPKDLRNAVECLYQSWSKFVTLSQNVKDSLSYNEDEGYELQTKKGDTRDQKEDFHATLASISRVADATENQTVDIFLQANTRVLNLIESVILSVAQSIETNGNNKGFVQSVFSSKERWIVRCIHYLGSTEIGSEIASGHPDKSGLTLHLYEDAPGFH